MAKIRAFTTIEESRKLAEILPLESADMIYTMVNGRCTPFIRIETIEEMDEDDVLCWSLAALLEQLPYELCDDDGNSSYLQINKEGDMYQLAYEDPYGDFESIETDRQAHFVDACYDLIIKLHKLNLL